MKQISLALAMYASDNTEYLPAPDDWNHPWDDYISEYDGRDISSKEIDMYRYSLDQTRHDLYACPHDERTRPSSLDATIRSYSANSGVPENWNGTRGGIQSGHRVRGDGKDPWSSAISQPTDSSATIMASEYADANKLGGSAQGYRRAYDIGQFLLANPTYHGVTPTALNYMFADGHVEHLQFIETWGNTTVDLWTDVDVRGTPWDWFPDK